MYRNFFFGPLICFAPDDETGAGADTVAGGAGSDTIVAGGGADTVAAGAGSDTVAAGGDAAPVRWWEGDKFKDYRPMLEAKGLTLEDQGDVIAKLAKSEMAAQAKLGKPADQLLSKPGKDESITDWMKANAEMFGIPEAADKYEISKPESWPKDAKWDDSLEAKVREIGHAQGMSNSAVKAMVDLYAGTVLDMDRNAQTTLESANAAMMADLQKDWGDQTQAKLTLAAQGASVVAEKAGLDATAMENLAATLQPKIGDAGTMRIFAAIGEMLGDDMIVQGGGGGGSLGTTPAEARAELARLKGAGGEYYEAVSKRDKATLDRLKPTIERLTKIAAN